MTDIAEITFGSRWRIVVLRTMQVLFPVMWLYLVVFTQLFGLCAISLCFLVVWELFVSRTVLAKLDDRGLRYQRWREWQQLTWTEITYGGPTFPGHTKVKIVARPFWNRYLDPPNPPAMKAMTSPILTRFQDALRPMSGRTN